MRKFIISCLVISGIIHMIHRYHFGVLGTLALLGGLLGIWYMRKVILAVLFVAGIVYSVTHFHTVLFWTLIVVGGFLGIAFISIVLQWIVNWYKRTFLPDESYLSMDDIMKDLYQNKNLYHKHMKTVLRNEAIQISNEDASDRIYKLPTEGDYTFVLGEKADGELYVILPKPKFGADPLPEEIVSFLPLEAVNLSDQEIPTHEISIFHSQTATHRFKVDSVDEFERFFDVSDSHTFKQIYKKFQDDLYYRLYCFKIQERYFNNQDQLLKELDEAVTADDYRRVCMALEGLKTPNAEIVRMMRPTQQEHSPEEIAILVKKAFESMGHYFDSDQNDEKSNITLHKEGDKNEWT
ncbi:hypothetical protein [Priestia koreensis]|uniref:Uncharacterized protein n=1 Tax=Priestia koreensis TaxID=284581 RepID=A0A0M0LAV6_9BACI|nr:hypothetical protein [Priestia koreensis]KOO48179.1 hypothetical protein AMD01_05085 [Priestia koreensis]